MRDLQAERCFFCALLVGAWVAYFFTAGFGKDNSTSVIVSASRNADMREGALHLSAFGYAFFEA